MNPDQTAAKKAVKSRAILLQYMLPKSISRSRIEDDKSSDWYGKWVKFVFLACPVNTRKCVFCENILSLECLSQVRLKSV